MSHVCNRPEAHTEHYHGYGRLCQGRAESLITGATCGLCGEQSVPDFPSRPDTYIHRATGDEDCE